MNQGTKTKGNKKMEHIMIGVSDEILTCAICGKDELKKTIVLAIIEEGEVVGETFAGSECASRLLKGQVKGTNKLGRKSRTFKDDMIKNHPRFSAFLNIKKTDPIRAGKILNSITEEIEKKFPTAFINHLKKERNKRKKEREQKANFKFRQHSNRF
jgi:hypothetical protein